MFKPLTPDQLPKIENVREEEPKIHATLWPVEGGWMWKVEFGHIHAESMTPVSYDVASYRMGSHIKSMSHKVRKEIDAGVMK